MSDPGWTVTNTGALLWARDGESGPWVAPSDLANTWDATPDEETSAAFDALVAAVRDAEQHNENCIVTENDALALYEQREVLSHRVSTLRCLAYELAHGNRPRMFEGRLHWYSPDENGQPHSLNGPLSDAEVAEWEALEVGE